MCRFVEKPRRTCGNSCIVDARNENPVGKRRWFHQNEKWDKREMEDFFFLPFFLPFLPLFRVIRALRFSKGILNVNFFVGVFCRIFFRVFFFFVFFYCCCCYRCWPSIRLGMIVSIQRFANVCPCLIECRSCVRLCVYSILFFFFYFSIFFQIYSRD